MECKYIEQIVTQDAFPELGPENYFVEHRSESVELKHSKAFPHEAILGHSKIEEEDLWLSKINPSKQILDRVLDLNDFQKITIIRYPSLPPLPSQDKKECDSFRPDVSQMLDHFVNPYQVFGHMDLHQRRLAAVDECPVHYKLASSRIGEQLFIAMDWQSKPGDCNPLDKRALPRPARNISDMVKLGMIGVGEKVVYRGGHNRVMAEGWIANDGILCARCGYVVGVTEFEKCAGMKMRKPGKHIQFRNGSSLLDHTQCLRHTVA